MPSIWTPESRCEASDKSDVRFESGGDGKLYLRLVNGAKFCNLADAQIRIDGFGNGNMWCVETNAHHKAKVFINQDVAQPGSKELMLWVVTKE